MSKQHLFLAAFLLLLLQLPPTTPSPCQIFHRSICMKQDSFVPGHSFIGEGVDITSLERKGAFVVDTSQWQGPNGTCILCRNPLMKGKLQKLPLAGVDWRVLHTCHQDVSSSIENLDVDVANSVAKEVKNDWKAELGLGTVLSKAGLELPKMRVALAGSHSRMAIYAHEKSRQDSHIFVRQEVSCAYYRLRLRHRRSLLASHFSRALASLPRRNNSEEYQHFIDIYGTHYISNVQVGGRLRHLLAVQTCKMALWGITASSFESCLGWEVSLGHKWLFGSASLSSKCEDLRRTYTRGIFHDAYAKQRTEIVGGEKRAEILFSKPGAQNFSAWMESAKTKPGLVSYSLLPLHTLLNQRDPRRDLLKQSIVNYINQRALKRNCSQPCPRWSSQSSDEECTCRCHHGSFHSNMCCAWERGRAHLKFIVHRGYNLRGNWLGITDGYVKIFFHGQERRTIVIPHNNNPWWTEPIDFGAVTLSGHDVFEVQLWNKNLRGDRILGHCGHNLQAGAGTVWHKCPATHGHFDYYYTLVCGHTLSGPSCHNYVPLRLPTSYFN
ncbi:perforin-1-like isoform X2 [Podarcis lilfordi]|uniref:Perforin-1-like isoform X2 n=1 Tax=Podarcis lilfordi TaxID=74358 RepID=A0AA35PMM2_9SAUR|nr:perforin-1-like isoform X2 [Podarcis lilfordi]